MEEYKNSSLDANTLSIINSCEPLKSWFIKNNFIISYYGLCGAKYDFDYGKDSHYDLSYDLEIIKKMVTICLIWLRSKYNYSDEEKAKMAIAAINLIYRDKEKFLSPEAVKAFSIEAQGISEDFAVDALTPPDLKDLEIEYLNNKREDLIGELNQVDQRLSELQPLGNKL